MFRYLEDFEPGAVLLSPGRTVTEADAIRYAELTGDRSELSCNQSLAREPVGGGRSGLAAPGALVFSISVGLAASTDLSQKPDLIAFLGVDRMRFGEAVLLGDTIRLRQTVESAEPINETSGLLTMAEEVLNQKEATALRYTAKFLVRRRPHPRLSRS